VIFLYRVFVSDTHALAVLPNIARFTLDKKLPCAFIIITYESGEERQTVCSGKVMGEMWPGLVNADIRKQSGRIGGVIVGVI
jgi:hypothetical protein